MLWVGLTGGIASGKSTVAGLLRRSGIPIVDADELSHRAIRQGSSAYPKVLSHFGPMFLGPDGQLDRRALGARVFAHPEDLRFLESLIHPWVQEQALASRAGWSTQGHAFAVYDFPLLFEKNFQAQFDRVVVVGCKLETQIQRMILRNALTREESLLRLQSQLPLDQKMRQGTDLIWNEGSLADLELQVETLIQKFRALALR